MAPSLAVEFTELVPLDQLVLLSDFLELPSLLRFCPFWKIFLLS